MISLESIGINIGAKNVNVKKLDFDISQFCTLMERYKFTWRTAFQVILFRAFKSGKCDISNCQKLIEKLSFKKHHSSGLTGLLLKSILSRSMISKDPTSSHKLYQEFSLLEEFDFLTLQEITKILEYGAELWMILKKIHNTACNKSESLEPKEGTQGNIHLREQFDSAHDFFIEKVQTLNQQKQMNMEKVLKILGENGGKKR